MSNLKRSFFIILFSWFSIFTYGQESTQDSTTISSQVFGLKEIIKLARERSIWALRSDVTRENRYWQYRVYKSNYNPQLSFDGNFPSWTRRFDEVRQPDGTYDFKEVNINNSNVNLRLSQSLAATGTQFYLSSGVNRFDNFETGDLRYSGAPVALGLEQPLFFFNELKWDKRIEPLRYEESKREYIEDLENISLIATNRFFDLLLAQISLEIAQKNLANNDTIYKIGEGRYNLGKIAENELLDLELNVMNSRQQVSEALVALETSGLRLKTFVGITYIENVTLQLPAIIPDFNVNETAALDIARKNRPDAVGFVRRQLEAERDVAQARGQSGLNAILDAAFGLTGYSTTGLPDMYSNTVSSQQVRIGFQIPIVDWGRQKSRVKTAEASLKLEEYTIQLDEITFDEEIFTQVKQFKMLKEQVVISQKADEIADKRYNIAKNRYLIGKISITDLNLALRDKDDAKRAYIESLRSFWAAYYNLRFLTLYDFEKNVSLYDPETDT
jgi:outer membrane protein TolC